MDPHRRIRALGSRRTGIVLAVPVIGLNAAYLLRHGTGPALLITFALLALLALAVIGGAIARERQQQDREPRTWDYVQNGLLAFVLAASIYGIFG